MDCGVQHEMVVLPPPSVLVSSGPLRAVGIGVREGTEASGFRVGHCCFPNSRRSEEKGQLDKDEDGLKKH